MFVKPIHLDRENHIKVHYEKMQSTQKSQYGINYKIITKLLSVFYVLFVH